MSSSSEPETSFTTAVSASCLLGLSYVLSLYVWSSSRALDRDHPSTIKRRFVSAFCMLFVSPPFVYAFGSRSLLDSASSLAEVIGIRWAGLAEAIILPLLLTAVLFAGPIVMDYVAHNVRLRLLSMPQYWRMALTDLIWWRNHVVAPFTEEYTFRACILPILLGYYSPAGAVVVSPLFFGIAHLHHMAERIRKGQDVQTAVLISLFQINYTTVFGMYSAFLFVRTGHLAAPVVVHGFCNFMGFPDVGELVAQEPPRKRAALAAVFVVGLVLFFVLLFPMTEPSIYKNELYKW